MQEHLVALSISSTPRDQAAKLEGSFETNELLYKASTCHAAIALLKIQTPFYLRVPNTRLTFQAAAVLVVICIMLVCSAPCSAVLSYTLPTSFSAQSRQARHNAFSAADIALTVESCIPSHAAHRSVICTVLWRKCSLQAGRPSNIKVVNL